MARPRLQPTRVLRKNSPKKARSKKGPVRSWLDRQRDDLVREALIAFVALIIGIGAAVYFDDRIADRQEVQENTRFVRQVVIDGADEKAFRGLNLSGAALPGLDLSCRTFEGGAPIGCADLRNADLTEADMSQISLGHARLDDALLRRAILTDAYLSDAYLAGADLTGADLTGADLTSASLSRANLTDANLSDVHLKGADLTGSNLTGTDLTSIDHTYGSVEDTCFDESTIWPGGFSPPDYKTGACGR